MHAKPSSDAGVLDGGRIAEPTRAAPVPAPPAVTRRWRIPPAIYRFVALLGVLALVAYAIDRLDIDLDRLPGLLGRMGRTLAGRYFPPNLAHIAQLDYLHSVVETLQMSYLASVLGIVLAVPLAWLASANVTPSPRVGYPLARLAIMACRSVHEMIWTILLV